MIEPRPHWHSRAACAGMGPGSFFPLTQGSRESGYVLHATARLLCSTCPVVAECTQAGMSEQHGMWGGLSVLQRQGLAREARDDHRIDAGRTSAGLSVRSARA